jgi:hypothetical protein
MEKATWQGNDANCQKPCEQAVLEGDFPAQLTS